MFLDWPIQKHALEEALNVVLQRATMLHAPVAAQFSQFVVREGDRIVLVGSDGDAQSMDMKDLSISTKSDQATFRREGPSSLKGVIESLAEASAEQMERDVFAMLREVGPGSGGFFQGDANADFVEQFIEGLEQMDVSFDSEGKPTLFVTMHPDRYKDVTEQIEEAENSDEVQARVDAVMERKRNDWARRESRRRLAD